MTVDRSAFVDDSGETRFAGTIQPGPGTSAGDTLQSTGVDGEAAEWAAGGGSVALPLNLGPDLFQIDEHGATSITPDDGSDALTIVNGDPNDYDTLINASNTAMAVFTVDGGGEVTIHGSVTGAVELDVVSSNGIHSLTITEEEVKIASNDVAHPSTLGFFGKTPAAQPVVPLTTPSVQDVIDAMVVLGLVTQSD